MERPASERHPQRLVFRRHHAPALAILPGRFGRIRDFPHPSHWQIAHRRPDLAVAFPASQASAALPAPCGSSSTTGGRAAESGRWRHVFWLGPRRRMKRSRSPSFQVRSFGSCVAVAGTAVDNVSWASVQSSPVCCFTRPASFSSTRFWLGTNWMSYDGRQCAPPIR